MWPFMFPSRQRQRTDLYPLWSTIQSVRPPPRPPRPPPPRPPRPPPRPPPKPPPPPLFGASGVERRNALPNCIHLPERTRE